MIDVVHRKCSCGNRPAFNMSGKKPMFCSKCKTDDMIDVISKKCPCGIIPILIYLERNLCSVRSARPTRWLTS